MDDNSLETLLEEFKDDPNVVQAKWFGKPCLNVNGKAFAVKFGQDIAFKLEGDTHSNALKIQDAKLFDPRGQGKAFKEWVQIPVSSSELWGEYGGYARDYVVSLGK